jgi:toxin YhaV
MLTINGWTVLTYPHFLDQSEVQLAATTTPSDPTKAIYRQGPRLGDDCKHWFRASFGNGRLRLVCGYTSASNVIMFA